MNQLIKNLALEWAKDNIRANAVAPGPIATQLLESFVVRYFFIVGLFIHSRNIKNF